MTPNVVSLHPTGFVNLTDANGFICLMVAADDPLSWPHYFGVTAKANPAHPGNFDLSIVYNPPGGATGVPSSPEK